MFDQCEWTEDEDGVWFGDCGVAFVFPDGGPVENECWYCCMCGKPLKPIPRIEEDRE